MYITRFLFIFFRIETIGIVEVEHSDGETKHEQFTHTNHKGRRKRD